MAKAFLIAVTAAIVAYSLISFARFLYYRRQALSLVAIPTSQNYTLGSGGREREVIVLGDSTAVGVGATGYEHTYHYQYLSRRNDGFSYSVANAGVVGARISDLRGQLENIGRVDILFISIGGNDVTHATAEAALRDDLRNALRLAREKADTVILVTPGSLGDARIVPFPLRIIWGFGSRKLSALVSSVARDVSVTHVDVFSCPGASFARDPKRYFARDFFHPSNDGYRLWAEAIAATVDGVNPGFCGR